MINKEVLAENYRPGLKDLVRVKEMGNITELMFSACRNTSCKIKKIDSERYVNLETGEECFFEHMDNRADDKNSIRVSLSKLRDYLNTNISNVLFCRWVTLTYAENMTDTKSLKNDFEKFIKRLRYKYGHFEYIVAREPQGRGSWHHHLVLIFNYKAPFIPNPILAEIWGHGFVTIKKLDDVDNVGAYLTSYLGDMELDEYIRENGIANMKSIKEVEIMNDLGEKELKRFVKGARLNMYPPNFNLFSCSTGIRKPDINYMSSEKAEKKISGDTLTFERTISLEDEEKGFNNTINYRYYNAVRK